MSHKEYETALERAWEALKPWECFFVPCVDELQAKKIGLSRGYHSQKNAPVAVVGIYRGMWGVMFYREGDRRGANPLKPPGRVRKRPSDEQRQSSQHALDPVHLFSDLKT